MLFYEESKEKIKLLNNLLRLEHYLKEIGDNATE